MQDGHGSRICVLSLPAEFGVADFCAFLAGFSKSVREMRIVRSEENKRHCLVFLNFESVKQAALFYKSYNGKAVSILLCTAAGSMEKLTLKTLKLDRESVLSCVILRGFTTAALPGIGTGRR